MIFCHYGCSQVWCKIHFVNGREATMNKTVLFACSITLPDCSTKTSVLCLGHLLGELIFLEVFSMLPHVLTSTISVLGSN